MDKALIARSFAKALKTYDGSAVVQRRVVREMVRLMRAHDFPEASAIYEVGAGKVLSGLVKRIADGASGTAVGTPDDVAAFKAARGS